MTLEQMNKLERVVKKTIFVLVAAFALALQIYVAIECLDN